MDQTPNQSTKPERLGHPVSFGFIGRKSKAPYLRPFFQMILNGWEISIVFSVASRFCCSATWAADAAQAASRSLRPLRRRNSCRSASVTMVARRPWTGHGPRHKQNRDWNPQMNARKSLDGAIYCHVEVETKLLLNCASQWQWQDGLVQDLHHHSFSSTLSDWRAGVWSIKKCLNRNQGAKMLPATFISFIVSNQADVTPSLVLSASASSKMPRIWFSSLEPSLLARLLVESAHLELVWAPVLHLHSAGSHLLTLALSRLNMPCPVTQVRSPANPRH